MGENECRGKGVFPLPVLFLSATTSRPPIPLRASLHFFGGGTFPPTPVGQELARSGSFTCQLILWSLHASCVPYNLSLIATVVKQKVRKKNAKYRRRLQSV